MPACLLPTPGPVDLSTWGFHSKATVGALVTTLPTVLISGGLLYSHSAHGTSRRHLKYLAVPILLPPIYAIISLLSIAFYAAAGYLEPLIRIFEALAIIAFFRFLHVCCQSAHGQPEMGKLGRMLVNISVYQLPLTLTILTITNEVLTAKACLLTDAFRLGRTVINICAFIVILIAVIGVLVYLRRTRHILRSISPMKKFCVLKAMIVIVTMEYLIIEAAVTKTHIAKQTHTDFYNWYYGIPALVVACEMPIFAGLMSWAFRESDMKMLGGDAATYAAVSASQPKPIDEFVMRGS